MTATATSTCTWCHAPVGDEVQVCPRCGLVARHDRADATAGGRVDPTKAATTARNRRTWRRIAPLGTTPINRPLLGVDPGARYTGVVLRDGDVPLYAETIVRNSQDDTTWARDVVTAVREVLAVEGALIPVAIEGISSPKGFKHGKRAALNPQHIIQAAVVLGALTQAFPEATVIAPGGNGSQHITHYPPALIGPRPADLPGFANGAKTRAHEQSAYDVAGKAASSVYGHLRMPLPNP